MASTYVNKNGWNIRIEPYPGDTWVTDSCSGEFVARFKYGRPTLSAKHFVKFLIANFTPTEYFAERAKGTDPMTILQSKGYVDYNTKYR